MTAQSKGTAEFFVSNKRNWEQNWKIARHFLPPARVRTFRDAVALPLRFIDEPGIGRNYLEGGLCDRSGRFVAGRRRSFWNDKVNNSFVQAYSTNGLNIEFRDESVIFGGILNLHWGHILTDSTPRLWYVTSHPEDKRRILFLRPPRSNKSLGLAHEDALDLFELAGIARDRILTVDTPTRFRSVTVPEEAVYSLDAVRPEWIAFFDAVRANVEPAPFKKVYFSRAKFKGCDTFNEDLFEQYWRNIGYHVVYPEECTLREEISHIAGADELAGTIGTLTHNFLFARPGTRATILLRTTAPLRLQLLIGAVRGLRSDYVETARNVLPTPHNVGTFFLAPVPRFLEYLRVRNFPAFGFSATDFTTGERVRAYVRRWTSSRITEQGIVSALQTGGVSVPQSLIAALKNSSGDDEQVCILSQFVKTELSRLADADTSGPPKTATRTPGLARRAKDAVHLIRNTWLHPRHDLF